MLLSVPFQIRVSSALCSQNFYWQADTLGRSGTLTRAKIWQIPLWCSDLATNLGLLHSIAIVWESRLVRTKWPNYWSFHWGLVWWPNARFIPDPSWLSGLSFRQLHYQIQKFSSFSIAVWRWSPRHWYWSSAQKPNYNGANLALFWAGLKEVDSWALVDFSKDIRTVLEWSTNVHVDPVFKHIAFVFDCELKSLCVFLFESGKEICCERQRQTPNSYSAFFFGYPRMTSKETSFRGQIL